MASSVGNSTWPAGVAPPASGASPDNLDPDLLAFDSTVFTSGVLEEHLPLRTAQSVDFLSQMGTPNSNWGLLTGTGATAASGGSPGFGVNNNASPGMDWYGLLGDSKP